MVVSDYEPARARELVEMWRASFERGVGIVDPHPIESQLGFFLDEVVPQCRVRTVLEGGRLVAFMASTPETIEHLYVHVDCHGHGIGSHLMDLAKAESSGCLRLHTFAQNANARRFYERHGFRELDREDQNMWRLEAIRYEWVDGPSP